MTRHDYLLTTQVKEHHPFDQSTLTQLIVVAVEMSSVATGMATDIGVKASNFTALNTEVQLETARSRQNDANRKKRGKKQKIIRFQSKTDKLFLINLVQSTLEEHWDVYQLQKEGSKGSSRKAIHGGHQTGRCATQELVLAYIDTHPDYPLSDPIVEKIRGLSVDQWCRFTGSYFWINESTQRPACTYGYFKCFRQTIIDRFADKFEGTVDQFVACIAIDVALARRIAELRAALDGLHDGGRVQLIAVLQGGIHGEESEESRTHASDIRVFDKKQTSNLCVLSHLFQSFIEGVYDLPGSLCAPQDFTHQYRGAFVQRVYKAGLHLGVCWAIRIRDSEGGFAQFGIVDLLAGIDVSFMEEVVKPIILNANLDRKGAATRAATDVQKFQFVAEVPEALRKLYCKFCNLNFEACNNLEFKFDEPWSEDLINSGKDKELTKYMSARGLQTKEFGANSKKFTLPKKKEMCHTDRIENLGLAGTFKRRHEQGLVRNLDLDKRKHSAPDSNYVQQGSQEMCIFQLERLTSETMMYATIPVCILGQTVDGICLGKPLSAETKIKCDFGWSLGAKKWTVVIKGSKGSKIEQRELKNTPVSNSYQKADTLLDFAESAAESAGWRIWCTTRNPSWSKC